MSFKIPIHMKDQVIDMMNSYMDEGLAGGLAYTMERIIDIAAHKKIPLRIINVEGRWLLCMLGLAQVVGGLTSLEAQSWLNIFSKRSNCQPKTVFIDQVKQYPPWIPLHDFLDFALPYLKPGSSGGYVKIIKDKYEYYRYLVSTGSSEACRIASYHTAHRIERSIKDPELGIALQIEAALSQTPFDRIRAGFIDKSHRSPVKSRYPRYCITDCNEDQMYLQEE